MGVVKRAFSVQRKPFIVSNAQNSLLEYLKKLHYPQDTVFWLGIWAASTGNSDLFKALETRQEILRNTISLALTAVQYSQNEFLVDSLQGIRYSASDAYIVAALVGNGDAIRLLAPKINRLPHKNQVLKETWAISRLIKTRNAQKALLNTFGFDRKELENAQLPPRLLSDELVTYCKTPQDYIYLTEILAPSKYARRELSELVDMAHRNGRLDLAEAVVDLSLKGGFYEDTRETLLHDIEKMLDLDFLRGVNKITVYAEQQGLIQAPSVFDFFWDALNSRARWSPIGFLEEAIKRKADSSAMFLFNRYEFSDPKELSRLLLLASEHGQPQLLQGLSHVVIQLSDNVMVREILQAGLIAAVKHVNVPCLKVLLFGETQRMIAEDVSKTWLESMLREIPGASSKDEIKVLLSLVKTAKSHLPRADLSDSVMAAFKERPQLSASFLENGHFLDGLVDGITQDRLVGQLVHIKNKSPFQDIVYLLRLSPSQALSVYRECLESDYEHGIKVMERLFGRVFANMDAWNQLSLALLEGQNRALSILIDRYGAYLTKEVNTLFLQALSNESHKEGLLILCRSNQFISRLSTDVMKARMAKKGLKMPSEILSLLSPKEPNSFHQSSEFISKIAKHPMDECSYLFSHWELSKVRIQIASSSIHKGAFYQHVPLGDALSDQRCDALKYFQGIRILSLHFPL